jgi:biopolymer transport protein ExbB
VFEIIRAGGWVMGPIILCSIIATAIIAERFWSLRKWLVVPKGLVTQVWKWVKEDKLDKHRIEWLRKNSPLGRILAAGLSNRHQDRETMRARMEEASNQVIHELERYLNTLGIIAEIAPLLGLLGTVTGIIRMLAAVGEVGLGNPMALSSGLSEALVTTAAGLIVAIPAVVGYRYFQRVIDDRVLTIEQEVAKMLDVIQGEDEL